MTIVIKKTDTKEAIEKKLLRLYTSRKRNAKGFDAMKYMGKGILGGIDGLYYQKKARKE